MNSFDRARTAVRFVLASLLAATFAARSAHTQSQPPGQAIPYRPPTIALVQPGPGSSMPRDRPVVVFRFAPGEPGDPIDARTFAVVAKGIDQRAHFQITAGEAWGALVDPESADSLLAPGTHEVSAMVCSIRGACGTTTATVLVGAALPGSTAATSHRADAQPSSRAQFIARLLDAVRRLLVP